MEESVHDKLSFIKESQKQQLAIQTELLNQVLEIQKRFKTIESTQAKYNESLSEIKQDIKLMRQQSVQPLDLNNSNAQVQTLGQAVAHVAPYLNKKIRVAPPYSNRRMDQKTAPITTKPHYVSPQSPLMNKRGNNLYIDMTDQPSSSSTRNQNIELEDDDDAPLSSRTRFVRFRRGSQITNKTPAKKNLQTKKSTKLIAQQRTPASVLTKKTIQKKNSTTTTRGRGNYKKRKIHCEDNDKRDIKRTSEKARAFTPNITDNIRFQAMLAILLSDKLERDISVSADIVLHHVNYIRKIAKDVDSHLVAELATLENISLKKAVQKRWSAVPDEIQDKYALLLEKKTLKETGLEIGRCENMWASRLLIVRVVSNRINPRYVDKYAVEVKDHVDSCDQYCNTTGMVVDKQALSNSPSPTPHASNQPPDDQVILTSPSLPYIVISAPSDDDDDDDLPARLLPKSDTSSTKFFLPRTPASQVIPAHDDDEEFTSGLSHGKRFPMVIAAPDDDDVGKAQGYSIRKKEEQVKSEIDE